MSERRGSRSSTVFRMYLIVGLFVAIIIILVVLFKLQMDASVAIRVYVGGEGLWAKAQKDAILSLEHYAVSHNETDYQNFLRMIEVPLGDRKARMELQKPEPDLDVVRKGYIQGRVHPVDIEYAIPFFRRFQHTTYLSHVIAHWIKGDQQIVELGRVAEALHALIRSRRASPGTIRTLLDEIVVINRNVTEEENQFSSTLAEASRWANDVSRKLTYSIAFLFVVLGVVLSWPIVTRIRTAEDALRQSEEKFRIIFDSANDGILLADIEKKKFTLGNEKICRMLGYGPEEIKTLGVADIHPEKDLPRIIDQFERLQRKEFSVSENLPVKRRDGTVFFSDISASPVTLDGKLYLVGIFRDISERKKSEDNIRKLNQDLEVKVKELLAAQEELMRKEKLATLGQLSGSVGHELRNPLGVMSNAVYFLKMVLSDANQTTKEYLDIIKKEIDNSLRIINDLLDFARTKPPQRTAVTPDDLVRQSLGRCAIPEKVTVEVDVSEALPRLNVDPLQMVQVLVNFITNAVQAMPGGGPVRVSARVTSDDGRGNRDEGRGTKDEKEESSIARASEVRARPSSIEISVADTGEGISPENRGKLFQPLFTTKAKGIGLGLVVCKNLVEANGGRIGVTSEMGKGTTFTLSLPAEETEL